MRRTGLPVRGQEEEIVLEALNLHTERLMTIPHVVGVGMREAARGQYVVAVYVDRVPMDNGPQEDRIPTSLPLEREKAKQPLRVPTSVEQVGTFELERCHPEQNRVSTNPPPAKRSGHAQAFRRVIIALGVAAAALAMPERGKALAA